MSSTEQKALHRFIETRKVALVGAVVNLVLSVVKIFLGVIAHSESLLVDGIHSLSDLLSDGMVYFAASHAKHGPDPEHPYGHGRFETAATMGLGALLIIVAIGISWDAFGRMFEPERLLQPDVIALYGAAFSIFANEALYQYTLRVGHKINSNMLIANAWHHRSDAMSSIVVLVGVAGTIAGLPYLDAIAAVGVGLMIGKIGWDLAWNAMQELVDAGLNEDRIEAIRGTILAVGGVRSIHTLRTRRIGGVASADVHVQVKPKLSVSEGHMIAVKVEERLKKEIEEIEDVTVHIDPEDDEFVATVQSLPLRNEAIIRLEKLWKDIECPLATDSIILHYLGGKIDVDVYLNIGSTKLEKNLAQLQNQLQEAVGDDVVFGRIKAFIQV